MTVGQHRKGDKYRGQGGNAPDPNRIRWRLEWHDGGPQSEPFSSRMALEDRKRELERRGFTCHVVNV